MQKGLEPLVRWHLILQKIRSLCFQFASVVVDIFDKYDIQNSIKKAERDRRSKSDKNFRLWGFHNNATLNVILLIQFGRIQCMQNYAGIRLFLCACQTTAIQLVLYVHYFPKMKNTSELWFQTGLIMSTKDCRCYIPVHELCRSLSSVVCEILHALSGCDTTSSFFGIGKKSMFKALKETPNQFSDLSRSRPNFPSFQPCSKGYPTAGFGICAFNYFFAW
jgi:hypothetical protein